MIQVIEGLRFSPASYNRNADWLNPEPLLPTIPFSPKQKTLWPGSLRWALSFYPRSQSKTGQPQRAHLHMGVEAATWTLLAWDDDVWMCRAVSRYAWQLERLVAER